MQHDFPQINSALLACIYYYMIATSFLPSEVLLKLFSETGEWSIILDDQ